MTASELTLPVDVTDAFDHLFLAGLASILEDEYDEPCSWKWNDFQHATLYARAGCDVDEVAQVVSNHVRRWVQSMWLRAKGDYTCAEEETPLHDAAGSEHATLSPRLSGISVPHGWKRLQKDRHTAIDALVTNGDRRYVGALGEPAYWHWNSRKQAQPDNGASRWEMVTRNQGKEFVGGRLLPLAEALANRSVEDFKVGLLGERVVDEIGSKSKSDSRTATGLHRPQPTDNARAWCALMGVAAFPHMITTKGTIRDATACLTQMTGSRRFVVLPVFDQAWSLSKYRSVTRSAMLLRFGVDLVENGALQGEQIDEGQASAGGRWLAEKGVVACVISNQYVSDNKSAPERWLERGRLYAVPRQ